MGHMKPQKTRTTITLDAALLRQIKQRAAAAGTTVSAYLAELARVDALTAAKPSTPVKLPTFKSGGLRPGVDLTSNAALREILDEDLPLEKLR